MLILPCRDYKKLTFYFYAEQYINFNDLVTELFKIWKLRIWLSAVNPASYPEQRSRPNRGNRLRGEPSLGGGSSDMDSHEHGFREAHHHPNSGALLNNMSHYPNVNQHGYGNNFPTSSYMQAPSFGSNFGQSNQERVAMNPAYFGSPAASANFPNASSGNFPTQSQWSSFGNPYSSLSNYPTSQTSSGTTSGQGNLAGQSLAGFASATPFFPSYQAGARRTSSIGQAGMGINQAGDTTGK